MTNAYTGQFDFSGRTVVVTGAAAGIGHAIAVLFAAQGADLVLLDTDPVLAETAARIGGKSLALHCDVSRTDQLRSAIRQAESRFGRIDVLVNNAGIALLDRADDVDEAAWERTMAINLKGPFFLAQAVARSMAGLGRGRIINIASQASVIALERHAAYCASKAALVAMTQVLAIEWAAHGITVNAVSPTVVETELGKKAWAGEVGEAMKRSIPVGRFAQPSEIAGLVAFLASDHAAMITGANLLIDGGYTIK